MKTVNEKFKTLMSDYFWNHVNDTLLADDSEFMQLAKEAEDLSNNFLKKYWREAWHSFDEITCINNDILNKLLEASYIQGILDSKELFSELSE